MALSHSPPDCAASSELSHDSRPAQYIEDRLEGFGGTGQSFQYQDLVDFPDLAKRVFGDPGRSRRRALVYNGPIGVWNAQAAQTDVEHLRAAPGQVGSDAMRPEHGTAAKAGFVLQLDRPDLAMDRHIQFAGLPLEEFRKMARLHVEARSRALTNIPPDQLRLHLSASFRLGSLGGRPP